MSVEKIQELITKTKDILNTNYPANTDKGVDEIRRQKLAIASVLSDISLGMAGGDVASYEQDLFDLSRELAKKEQALKKRILENNNNYQGIAEEEVVVGEDKNSAAVEKRQREIASEIKTSVAKSETPAFFVDKSASREAYTSGTVIKDSPASTAAASPARAPEAQPASPAPVQPTNSVSNGADTHDYNKVDYDQFAKDKQVLKGKFESLETRAVDHDKFADDQRALQRKFDVSPVAAAAVQQPTVSYDNANDLDRLHRNYVIQAIELQFELNNISADVSLPEAVRSARLEACAQAVAALETEVYKLSGRFLNEKREGDYRHLSGAIGDMNDQISALRTPAQASSAATNNDYYSAVGQAEDRSSDRDFYRDFARIKNSALPDADKLMQLDDLNYDLNRYISDSYPRLSQDPNFFAAVQGFKNTLDSEISTLRAAIFAHASAATSSSESYQERYNSSYDEPMPRSRRNISNDYPSDESDAVRRYFSNEDVGSRQVEVENQYASSQSQLQQKVDDLYQTGRELEREYNLFIDGIDLSNSEKLEGLSETQQKIFSFVEQIMNLQSSEIGQDSESVSDLLEKANLFRDFVSEDIFALRDDVEMDESVDVQAVSERAAGVIAEAEEAEEESADVSSVIGAESIARSIDIGSILQNIQDLIEANKESAKANVDEERSEAAYDTADGSTPFIDVNEELNELYTRIEKLRSEENLDSINDVLLDAAVLSERLEMQKGDNPALYSPEAHAVVKDLLRVLEGQSEEASYAAEIEGEPSRPELDETDAISAEGEIDQSLRGITPTPNPTSSEEVGEEDEAELIVRNKYPPTFLEEIAAARAAAENASGLTQGHDQIDGLENDDQPGLKEGEPEPLYAPVVSR